MTRSVLVGCSRRTLRRPATAARQAPSQSACASAGDVMPQKSTYFYPKLPSGLLFMPL
jgi:hypothetical protein